MLSQDMKPSAHPNPMPSENWVKSKCYQHTSVIFKLWWFIGYIYLMAYKNLSWSLLIGWSWANQGISLVDHLNLGAYELIELDKYAMLLAMRCLNG